MSEIIGSDWNGTFDSNSKIRNEVSFICTGMSWDEYDEFMFQKDDKNIKLDIPVFFASYASKDWSGPRSIEHKADVINKTKATKYYENDETTINVLKIMCPKCKIINVKKI